MTPIYHITHRENLGGVLERGVLCERECQDGVKILVNSGHRHIKERRARFPVTVAPDGVLADYAPFYFAPRSPMLYAIHRNNVEGVSHGQRDMLHLVSSCEAARDMGLRYVFTDGHAIMKFSSFFTDLRHLDQIDWAVMNAQYWNDEDGTGERPRKRQAEFLVHRCLPWDLVTEIGAIDLATAKTVRALIADSSHQPSVSVRRGWYY